MIKIHLKYQDGSIPTLNHNFTFSPLPLGFFSLALVMIFFKNKELASLLSLVELEMFTNRLSKLYAYVFAYSQVCCPSDSIIYTQKHNLDSLYLGNYDNLLFGYNKKASCSFWTPRTEIITQKKY